jgi:1,4-dihydroxy-6-naphthoate synthase
LKKILDLGEYWEGSTGAPIPLGGIVINRALPRDTQQAMNRVMRKSVQYAFAHPDASRAFVRAHAQEMSENVMRQHIELYVNAFSIDLGVEGRHAVELLFQRAAETGLIARPEAALFVGAR